MGCSPQNVSAVQKPLCLIKDSGDYLNEPVDHSVNVLGIATSSEPPSPGLPFQQSVRDPFFPSNLLSG